MLKVSGCGEKLLNLAERGRCGVGLVALLVTDIVVMSRAFIPFRRSLGNNRGSCNLGRDFFVVLNVVRRLVGSQAVSLSSCRR